MTIKSTRRATRADPSAAAPMSDPAMVLVGKLTELWAEIDRLDNAILKHHRAGTVDPEFKRQYDSAVEAKEATSDALTRAQATSIEGALAQIALASGTADIIALSEPEEDDQDRAQAIKRLLYSAVTVIEAHTSEKRPGVLVRCYMSDDLNPLKTAQASGAKRGSTARAETGPTAPETTTDAGDDLRYLFPERAAYCELPFVEADDKGHVKSHWSPPVVGQTEDGRSHAAECDMGTTLALNLITYLRGYPRDNSDSNLAGVAEAIVKRGKWGGIEIGFFSALGNFIESGRVYVSVGWTAEFMPSPGAAGGK